MSVRLLVWSIFTISNVSWSKTIDAQACAVPLSPQLIQNLIAESPHRKTIDNGASFLPGDAEKIREMIDIRGSDTQLVAETIVRHLQPPAEVQRNPLLFAALKAALHLSHVHNAIFSITAENGADKKPRVLASLDFPTENTTRGAMVRLPFLDVENGTPIKRIDIDINETKISVIAAKAQSVSISGKVLISDNGGHNLGLEIDGRDPMHPVLDAAFAKTKFFIGPQAMPELNYLLTMATEVVHQIYPNAHDVAFRTRSQIEARNQGQRWELAN